MAGNIGLQVEGRSFFRGLLLGLAFFGIRIVGADTVSSVAADSGLPEIAQEALKSSGLLQQGRRQAGKVVAACARLKLLDCLINYTLRKQYGKCLWRELPFLLDGQGDKLAGSGVLSEVERATNTSRDLCADVKSAVVICLVKELGTRLLRISRFTLEDEIGAEVVKDLKVPVRVPSELEAHKELGVDLLADILDVVSEKVGDGTGLSSRKLWLKGVLLQKGTPCAVKAFMKSPCAQKFLGMDLASEEWKNLEKGLFFISKYVLPKAGDGVVGKATVKFGLEVFKRRFPIFETYLAKHPYQRELVDKLFFSVATTYLLTHWNRVPCY
jgi:hypothetical protein